MSLAFQRMHCQPAGSLSSCLLPPPLRLPPLLGPLGGGMQGQQHLAPCHLQGFSPNLPAPSPFTPCRLTAGQRVQGQRQLDLHLLQPRSG